MVIALRQSLSRSHQAAITQHTTGSIKEEIQVYTCLVSSVVFSWLVVAILLQGLPMVLAVYVYVLVPSSNLMHTTVIKALDPRS